MYTSKQLAATLFKYEPDIAKMDIERKEALLTGCDKQSLSIPFSWMIEVNSEQTREDIQEHLENLGFLGRWPI
jgi:Uma2 family endonuclease